MLLVSKANAHIRKIPEDFGFRHLRYKFRNDPVDVIVISKPGESRVSKPIFFFCQDKLPQPVITYDESGLYDILPFDEHLFLDQFHIVIVGKPFVPIIANANQLDKNFCYFKNSDAHPPLPYLERNHLDYFVYRNQFVLTQIGRERWGKNRNTVLAGHGEGSAVAAKLASVYKHTTHLIYSCGNPYGEIMDVAALWKGTHEEFLEYWQSVVAYQSDTTYQNGGTYKSVFGFSLPPRDHLMQLQLPVFVHAANENLTPYDTLFEVETIRERKTNFTFFRNADEKLNSDALAKAWLEWLNNNPK